MMVTQGRTPGGGPSLSTESHTLALRTSWVDRCHSHAIHPIKSHDCAYLQRGQEVQTCHGPHEGHVSIWGQFYVRQSTVCLEALIICPQRSVNVSIFPPTVFVSQQTPQTLGRGSDTR